MKALNREELVSKLEGKYPDMNVMLTEDFFSLGGTELDIWLGGEDVFTNKSGDRLFKYYNDSAKYKFGVLKTLVSYLDKRGWYPEWYDAGTLMLYQK